VQQPGRMHPFRFMTSMPPLGDVGTWRDRVRRIEDIGFDTVAVSDHLSGGWSMDPTVVMAVAAEATTRLRVASLVLASSLRHPVLIHRAIANLDVLSDGRVELGIGAGWLRADFEALGLTMPPPAARLESLEEAVEIIQALFRGETVDRTGKHYTVQGAEGVPAPVQRPHPPLIIGGGGRRVLSLAGRVGSVAGIALQQSAAGELATHRDERAPARLDQKVAWVRGSARSAGRDPDDVVLQLSMVRVRVRVGARVHEWHSSQDTGDPPRYATLEGDVDECVQQLVDLRAEHGVSYVHLGNNLDAATPIVRALGGH
jgi:probable F420-dependent oxidoreductase